MFDRQTLSEPGNQVNGCPVEGQPPGQMPDTSHVLWLNKIVSRNATRNQVNGHQDLNNVDNPIKDPSHCKFQYPYIGNEQNGRENQGNRFRIKATQAKKELENPDQE